MSFRANSVRAVSRQQSSVLVPTFSSKITSTRVSVHPIGMVRNSRLFNSFVASVQPVEASAVTPFDNTLPSKGKHQDLISFLLGLICIVYVCVSVSEKSESCLVMDCLFLNFSIHACKMIPRTHMWDFTGVLLYACKMNLACICACVCVCK